MAIADGTTQLTTPELYIDDDLIAIIPNSLKDIEPGEIKSRWISTGGASGSIVHSLDGETLLPTFSFDLPNTPLNRRRVKDWKSRNMIGDYLTVRMAWQGTRETDAYIHVAITNAPDREYSSEGNISIECSGYKR